VFRLVDEVMKANATPYYLIGLTAAELLLLEENIDPYESMKKWRDMDFAIRVSSMEACQRIRNHLVEAGFIVHKKPFSLRHHAYSVAMELVPFGEIETAEVSNPVMEKILLKAIGIREALEQSTLVILDDKLVAEVPPLHGIAMLMLISWSGNPRRGIDLDDFYWIFINYLQMESDTILARYGEAIREPMNEPDLIVAEVIGMRIAELVHKSPKLRRRLLGLFDKSNHLSKQGIAWVLHRRIRLELKHSVEIVKRLRRGMMSG
jgi:predicted nucleotidyltransferase